jgi:hypothetical protein
MPCLVVLLAFFAPRVTSVLLWLFTGFFERAFGGQVLLLLLGIVLFPFTTLVYAWALNAQGGVSGFWLVLLIVAVIMDVSSWEGGRRTRRA